MIVVALCQCPCHPCAEYPLSRTLAPEQKYVTCVNVLQELFLTYAVEHPEHVLVGKEMRIHRQLVCPEVKVVHLSHHMVVLRLVVFNYGIKLLEAFNHVLVIVET